MGSIESCTSCLYVSVNFADRTGSKFDQLTGSKVIESILSRLDEGGVDLLVGQLQQMFCHPITTVINEER